MAAISFSRFLIPTPPPPLAAVHRSSTTVFRSAPLPHPLRRTTPLHRRLSSGQENGGGAAETLGEQEKEEEKEEKVDAKAAATADMRELMAARKGESSGADLLGGVADEVREIEWPEFRKVVGTTGVVLAVIAGSSVALLTVNGLLAELSDRVFAGKGFLESLIWNPRNLFISLALQARHHQFDREAGSSNPWIHWYHEESEGWQRRGASYYHPDGCPSDPHSPLL